MNTSQIDNIIFPIINTSAVYTNNIKTHFPISFMLISIELFTFFQAAVHAVKRDNISGIINIATSRNDGVKHFKRIR